MTDTPTIPANPPAQPPAKIIMFPGVESPPIPVHSDIRERMFAGARVHDVKNLILIGRARDGEIYVASEEDNVDVLVGVLLRTAHYLTDGGDTAANIDPPSGDDTSA